MSSPYAVIGLTYAGTDIQDPNAVWLELLRGLNEPPRVRGKDVLVPRLSYRIPRNRRADTHTIELVGWVEGQGLTQDLRETAFRANVDVVQALFSVTRDPADLVATLEDGSQVSISCRPLPDPVWTQIVPHFATLSLELEAYEDWTAVGS